MLAEALAEAQGGRAVDFATVGDYTGGMLVMMKATATAEEIRAVCAKIEELGYRAHPIPGTTRTVSGSGVECQEEEQCQDPDCIRTRTITICNNTTVSVTINAVTVSASAVSSSTASSVANSLASAINSNVTLAPIVGATVSGNRVNVFARTAGTEYSYPWSASCTHSAYFDYCAFEGQLSPIATLAPPRQ